MARRRVYALAPPGGALGCARCIAPPRRSSTPQPEHPRAEGRATERKSCWPRSSLRGSWGGGVAVSLPVRRPAARLCTSPRDAERAIRDPGGPRPARRSPRPSARGRPPPPHPHQALPRPEPRRPRFGVRSPLDHVFRRPGHWAVACIGLQNTPPPPAGRTVVPSPSPGSDSCLPCLSCLHPPPTNDRKTSGHTPIRLAKRGESV